ncbi:MAG: phosphoribosylglycinamide formyltransferase [Halioglobus sp.]
MQAFIDACTSNTLPARISVVISNNPGAAGLQRAAEAGIESRVINHRDYSSREAFDEALVAQLQPFDVDVVVLAGFMRILSAAFIEPFAGRLFNIHPSLLPKYPGLNTHQRAVDAGDDETGATVHFVTQELDGGPPVLQAAEEIRAGDTAQDLAERVRTLEHIIYPTAVHWFLQGRLQLDDGRALLDGKPLAPTGIRYTELLQ